MLTLTEIQLLSPQPQEPEAQAWHADLRNLTDIELGLEADYITQIHLPDLHNEIVGPWKNVSIPIKNLVEDYRLSVDRLEAIVQELKERRLI